MDEKQQQCRVDQTASRRFREELPAIAAELTQSCNSRECFDHVNAEPIPSREAVLAILRRIGGILFPGYFDAERLDAVNVGYYLGQETSLLFEALSEQISLAIRHDCLRNDLPCTHCGDRGQETAIAFMKSLVALRHTLAEDIRAAHEGDPAARDFDEIIFSYPGFYSVTVYRIAHRLWELDVPLIPRIMAEAAHGRTGIDIHPGARIGERFFIDHGTGVVIGETTEIGNRVRIYQGVTLGALSLSRQECQDLRNRKRHPTIEDDVIIYANATILGGETVIGARSVIGGSVWLTHSVPPDSRVFFKNQELLISQALRTPDL
jgi:serine O-acetyltransferase